jgi:ribosome-associated toxin RatA of RatAB toxin-antitoxin module
VSVLGRAGEESVMPSVHVSEFIRGEPARVYALFRDPEAFPAFMPNVQSVEVAERGDGWMVSEWVTDLDGAPLCWREVDSYDDAGHVVHFRLVEGDVERMEGRWVFVPCDAGTMAVCEIDYDLGVSVIEEAVGPIIREKLTENIDQMLIAIKQRVEAGASIGEEAPWAGSSH